MTEVKITKSETHNYHTYTGHAQAQPAYIELDCRDGELSSDWDGEVGNGCAAAVWNGLVKQWSIPATLQVGSINDAMETIKDLCQATVDGFESVWDGSNWVGEYSESAQHALEEIERILEYSEYGCEHMNIIDSWDAWFVDAVDFDDLQNHESCDAMMESVKADMCSIEDYYAEINEDFEDWLAEQIKDELDEHADLKNFYNSLPAWAHELDGVQGFYQTELEYQSK
jgi:hypothetical protein